jgi:predicted amidophosphoribosyltransferase
MEAMTFCDFCGAPVEKGQKACPACIKKGKKHKH